MQFCVWIDNFEQYFDTCLLITLNDLQNFVNNTKSVRRIEKQQTKTFHDFWVIENGLLQKKPRKPGNARNQRKAL